MRSGTRLSRAATRKFRNVLNGGQLHYYNPIGKPRAVAGGLAKFDGSGNRHVPGVGVCFVPPHPSPLPKERESAGTALENSDVAVAVAASLSLVSDVIKIHVWSPNFPTLQTAQPIKSLLVRNRNRNHEMGCIYSLNTSLGPPVRRRKALAALQNDAHRVGQPRNPDARF